MVAATAERKIVLITGCSAGGIGSALALEFHARGHLVFATGRTPAKMAHLAEAGVRTLEMDVTSDASIAAAVRAVIAAQQQETSSGVGGGGGGGGDKGAARARLDVLVNNAGVTYIMPFADADMARVRAVVDTNVTGVLAVTHALLPLLVAARGLVATVGSVNQVFNPPFQVPYNASKAALAAAADTLRVELAPLGVRVVHIVTGAVATTLMEHKGGAAGPDLLPPGSWYEAVRDVVEKRTFLEAGGVKFTTPEEYARQVVRDLTKEKQSPVLYRAASAVSARILSMFMWHGMLDSMFRRVTKLNAVTPPDPAAISTRQDK
ncbi:hypothetical protein GGTG_05850 [Gaeumannomyces tritici R3-111a-1]|uniref:NADPH-dependent 1-acyldihydroxyacetone phosphate reductase n=1 Tax=Gaeumannomyces tritici (strain R3-111a-1) TaxID=644352 RepID=J3NX43_GAET3|nr:hypothetical protein GGTG_05850 [Gaeumannomyces tritici R3-111a-1]EJT75925.1 hypothetical protein GGTG_05850 [Gaeumannomyces tritici R3-111a-1]